MRRTTRVLAGALMAAGLGLSGCGAGDEADTTEDSIPAVFEDEGDAEDDG